VIKIFVDVIHSILKYLRCIFKTECFLHPFLFANICFYNPYSRTKRFLEFYWKKKNYFDRNI